MNCVQQGESCDYSIRLNWEGRPKKNERQADAAADPAQATSSAAAAEVTEASLANAERGEASSSAQFTHAPSRYQPYPQTSQITGTPQMSFVQQGKRRRLSDSSLQTPNPPSQSTESTLASSWTLPQPRYSSQPSLVTASSPSSSFLPNPVRSPPSAQARILQTERDIRNLSVKSIISAPIDNPPRVEAPQPADIDMVSIIHRVHRWQLLR